MRTVNKPLSLEVLEARALFAADVVEGTSHYDEVMQALQSTGTINVSFDATAPAGVYRLLLVGNDETDITIDFDKLPSFVTQINVSKFDSITFSGKDSLVNLVAKDVNSLVAPEISTVGFEAKNVDYIELKSVSGYASIEGNRVQTHISSFEAINLTLNVNSLLLDADTLPKQVTVWNAHAVIAVPNVPATWDLSTFSGLEDKSQQLRLGSSDLTTKWDGVLEALHSASPIDASFDPNAPVGVYRLMLVGDSNANVTIDFDKLPSFVTSLNVSHFDSIVFEGKDTLVNLIASDVNSLKAPEISVIFGLEATNVDYIELSSVKGYASIQGDRVETHIGNFDAINLTLNVNSLLLDTESLPKQITLWNSKSIIALPHVPSSWDLSTVSGMEDKSQLRLGSSDITTGTPDVTETPQQPVVFSADLHVRALLDRLEVLYNQTGGFDAGMIRRIVAELNQPQQTVGTTVAPELILRRELPLALTTDGTSSISFPPIANPPLEVVVDPGQLLQSGAISNEKLEAYVSADGGQVVLVENPTLSSTQDDTSPAVVHVTINPEAEVATPQPTVWGIISQLVERGMDIKQYLVNQLTQEIVPGERGSVLLVDPKPIRGTHHQRTLG